MRWDRLDRAALAFVAALLVLIVALVLRGDQVGVQVLRTSPPAGASKVTTRSSLMLTFSEPVLAADVEARLRISPPLSGTWRWNGSSAFFIPTQPLQSDTLYTITLSAGARSEHGRTLLREVSWSFRTSHPRVAYLAPASGVSDLFVQEINTGPEKTPQRLTRESNGVFDYAVSPDGSRIAYSATRDDSGARDLWLINADGSAREQIVACNEQVCQSPSWSADGARIAFERHNLVPGTVGKTPGPARVWLYDLGSKTLSPLLNDTQQLGVLPRWAPSGTRLAYYDTINDMITVVDVATNERIQLPSVLGDPGAWSPDGQQIIYPELHASDVGQFNQLLRADLLRNTITATQPLSNSNDASVAWSPIGSQIAFSRQQTSGSASGGFTPFGPQIWVSTPDGRAARALTNEPEYRFGGLAWSPDGTWIVAVRSNLLTPNARPEVWLVRADGMQQYALAVDATLPAWIP
jgi:Tol biopolymer transport system component